MSGKNDQLLGARDLINMGVGKASFVYQSLASGLLPSILISQGKKKRHFKVRESDLEKWLDSRRVDRPCGACR